VIRRRSGRSFRTAGGGCEDRLRKDGLWKWHWLGNNGETSLINSVISNQEGGLPRGRDRRGCGSGAGGGARGRAVSARPASGEAWDRPASEHRSQAFFPEAVL